MSTMAIFTNIARNSCGRCSKLNASAWLLYLVVTPHLEARDDPVRRQRAEYDSQEALGWPSGSVSISDPPSLLAGRRLTWVSLAEKPLGLMAGQLLHSFRN